MDYTSLKSHYDRLLSAANKCRVAQSDYDGNKCNSFYRRMMLAQSNLDRIIKEDNKIVASAQREIFNG